MGGRGNGGGRGPKLTRKLAIQAAGQAEASGVGDVVGKLVHHHVLIDARLRGIWRERGLEDGLGGFTENLPHEDGLELPAGFRDLLLLAQARVAREPLQRLGGSHGTGG